MNNTQQTLKAVELDEKRCLAHEIILDLHKAKEIGQLQILFMYCLLSIKDLDPTWFPQFLKDNAKD